MCPCCECGRGHIACKRRETGGQPKVYCGYVRFSLRQLEYFVAVAEAGTLSGAAARCHVSQAGIALAVSELERGLGVQLLLRRKAKGVTLTAAGQRALADARAVLSRADELRSNAEASGGELSGSLPVGCYTTLSPFFLPPLLDTFAAAHPLLRLEFVEDAQPALQRRLLDGTLEVALLYDRDLHADLARRVIKTARPYVLLAEDHPMAAHPRVSLYDLAEEPLIRLDLPPSMQSFEQVLGSAGIDATVRHSTSNFELVRCLVGRGLGYAVLVQRPPSGLSYEGRRVVSRPIAEEVPDVSIVLAYPRGARLTRRAEALADFCLTIPD
ncbi:MAG: LysR family transcriptional regulator [Pseudonocardiaceae bacterium]|nr:LysR family transcriptional regulator [Pseudonocardiaceae bacterium]